MRRRPATIAGSTEPASRTSAAPRLDGLPQATAEALALFGRVGHARDGWVNGQGGDVASSGSHRSLVRHTANYLAALSLAGQAPAGARVVDVGGGVGAFSAWLSERLGARATLVDADPDVLRVAGDAFPELHLASSLEALPGGSAWLVTAMEVIEHVPPAEQPSFVRALARLVAPGGLLVLSTPDESRYLGRWSGYGPHVGVLEAAELESLLSESTGRRATVWRLEGEAFQVGTLERVLLPVANRAVSLLRTTLPSVLDRLGHALTRAGALLPSRPDETHHVATALPHTEGRGSGLLAVVSFA